MTKSPLQIFDDNFLYAATSPELGQIAPENTLRFWRSKKRGPSFVKITEGPRGRVGYYGRDLNDYLSKCRVEVA